jgi:hypothetical protein
MRPSDAVFLAVTCDLVLSRLDQLIGTLSYRARQTRAKPSSACASLMHTAGQIGEGGERAAGHSTIAMTSDIHTHLFDQGENPRILG